MHARREKCEDYGCYNERSEGGGKPERVLHSGSAVPYVKVYVKGTEMRRANWCMFLYVESWIIVDITGGGEWFIQSCEYLFQRRRRLGLKGTGMGFMVRYDILQVLSGWSTKSSCYR